MKKQTRIEIASMLMQVVHNGAIETTNGTFKIRDLQTYCMYHQYDDPNVVEARNLYTEEFRWYPWDFNDRWNRFCKTCFQVSKIEGRLVAKVDHNMRYEQKMKIYKLNRTDGNDIFNLMQHGETLEVNQKPYYSEDGVIYYKLIMKNGTYNISQKLYNFMVEKNILTKEKV